MNYIDLVVSRYLNIESLIYTKKIWNIHPNKNYWYYMIQIYKNCFFLTAHLFFYFLLNFCNIALLYMLLDLILVAIAAIGKCNDWLQICIIWYTLNHLISFQCSGIKQFITI